MKMYALNPKHQSTYLYCRGRKLNTNYVCHDAIFLGSNAVRMSIVTPSRLRISRAYSRIAHYISFPVPSTRCDRTRITGKYSLSIIRRNLSRSIQTAVTNLKIRQSVSSNDYIQVSDDENRVNFEINFQAISNIPQTKDDDQHNRPADIDLKSYVACDYIRAYGLCSLINWTQLNPFNAGF